MLFPLITLLFALTVTVPATVLFSNVMFEAEIVTALLIVLP